MIIACNLVHEGCRDTDLFTIDTSKITNTKLKMRLENAVANDWFEVKSEQELNVVWNSGAALPCQLDKLLTIYVP